MSEFLQHLALVLAWWLGIGLSFALIVGAALKWADTPDPFAACDPLSFRGIDEQ